MIIQGVPFQLTDRSAWPVIRYEGATGHALWRTLEVGNIRVRMVEYSRKYGAGHRCSRGDVLLVMQGALETELADGRRFTMTPGTSYRMAEGAKPQRSRTAIGATLFIVD